MATVVVPYGKGTRILNILLKRTESTKDISERSRRRLGTHRDKMGCVFLSLRGLGGLGEEGSFEIASRGHGEAEWCLCV